MKVRVNPKTGVLYMPKDLLDDGFKGEMNILYTPITFTIIHPRAKLEQVRESLENMIRRLSLVEMR